MRLVRRFDSSFKRQSFSMGDSQTVRRVYSFCLLMVIGIQGTATAQDRVRGHVYLPHTEGATVLSTHINAAANRLVALGDFLESAAIARRINLESDRVAMENSLIWVETYFKRRELNREYRDAARIDYKESQQIRMRERHERISTRDASDDVIGDLNYMLAALIREQNAYASVFLSAEPIMEASDQLLSPDDILQIILKESAGQEGATRIRLSNPQLIEDIWPEVFKREEFDAIREKYEEARGKAINEIENGRLSLETFERLNLILREMETLFDDVYKWSSMKLILGDEGIATFTHYREVGESFFRSQRAGALKAFARNNASSYSDQRQFNGDKLSDLLKYCDQHNLQFAEPESGGESNYRKLRQSLKQIYVEFISQIPSF